MVGFSLAHGAGVILFVFPILLLVWTVSVIIVTVWSMLKQRRVPMRRWVAIAAIVLLFILGSLPENIWERVFISRMAASKHAGDLMLVAGCAGDMPTLRGLVAHGVAIDAGDRSYWRTALHCAAAKGDTNAIRFLVSKGANINVVDRSGDSPLELAIANRQQAAARMLTDLGAKRIQGDQAQRKKAIEDKVREDIDKLQSR